MPIDYSKYPDNWLTEIRPRILKRANDMCEFCGVVNHSYVHKETREQTIQDDDDAVRIVLTVAHLDHDEENPDVQDDRLAALCQRCHLRYDAPEKKRRRLEKKFKNQHKLDL